MSLFEGQRAVVTGAATGIGRAVAMRLAAEGAKLALWDVDGPRLAATATELRTGGAEVTTAVLDVSDRKAVAAAAEAARAALGGPVGLLVNNAGIGKLGALPDVAEEDFRRTLEVNVLGSFNCLQLLLDDLSVARGAVVNMASWFGKSGRPFAMSYSASKGAVIAMTQSAAHDLAGRGVRVNAICPGTIDQTEMRANADREAAALGLPRSADRVSAIPLGRLGTPEDIAQVACFLLSPAAAYMTGEAINVTGGLWMT